MSEACRNQAWIFVNGERQEDPRLLDALLAKPVAESHSDAAISLPGIFAGTPQFASPEQFAGAGVDIRSDLYSLGVTLWEMLTGGLPTTVLQKARIRS